MDNRPTAEAISNTRTFIEISLSRPAHSAHPPDIAQVARLAAMVAKRTLAIKETTCPGASLVVRKSPPESDPLSDAGRLPHARAHVRPRARGAGNFANVQPVARLRVGG